MISTNQFKNGMAIIVDGEIYLILDFQHVKPGKGGAFVRVKLKNLKAGTIVDRTFRASQRIEEAFIEERKIQFLYCSSDLYYFLDQKTFEQMHISKEQLGENEKFLKEGMEITASLHNNRLVSIALPTFVELKVIETEPGFRGDTAKSGTKPAKLETNLNIQVPLFVNAGDIIKVDTRTGQYVERA